MAPLRCLTYGLIASRHLANQKRVRKAHDQRSVTQRMRRKLAGIFCFVTVFFLIRAMVPLWLWFLFLLGDWRTQTKIKFRDAAAQKLNKTNEKTIGVGSLGLLLTFFSLKTLKNGVVRTILFTPNNTRTSILIFRGCQIG